MKHFFTSIILGMLLLVGYVTYAGTGTKEISKIKAYSYLAGTTKPDEASVTNNYYNADGKLALTLTTSNKYVYTYNGSGIKTKMSSYYWSSTTNGWAFSSNELYEYDTEGNLTKISYEYTEGTVSSYMEYSNYVNGYFQDRKSMSADGSSVYYWSHFEYTFENELATTCFQSYISGTDTTILGRIDYTYTDGVLNKEVFSVNNSGVYSDTIIGAYIIDYTYDADGDILSEATTSISRYGTYVSDNDNIYSIFNSDYAPSNVQATAKTGAGVEPNIVELTWAAAISSDVVGYQVICDTLIAETISGTSYTTTAPAYNGVHTYAVVAIVDGSTRNISNMTDLTLTDEGVIPAENLAITAISEKNEDDGSYNVTVTWDAPSTSSTIESYQVYYSSWSYVETTETTAIVNIPYYYAEGTDENGDTYGLEVPIFVIAVYSTGFSENSDTVTCVPYDGPYTGVNSLKEKSVMVYPNPATNYIHFSVNVSANIYNLAGTIVKSMESGNELNISELKEGLYIVETKNKKGQKSIEKVLVNR